MLKNMSAPKIDSGIFSTNIGIFGGNGGIVSPGPGNSDSDVAGSTFTPHHC